MLNWVRSLAIASALIAAPAQAAGLLQISVSGTIDHGSDAPGYFTGVPRSSLEGYGFRFDVTFDTAKGVISNDYRSFQTGLNHGVEHGGTGTMTINGRTWEMTGLDAANYRISDDFLLIDFQDNLYQRPDRFNSFFRIQSGLAGQSGPRTIEDDVSITNFYFPESFTNFERTDLEFGHNQHMTRFWVGGPITVTVKGIPRRAPIPTPEPPTAPVPEPATWALMILGFGLAGVGLRTRLRVAA